jgi:hypothetical protein
VTIQRGLFQIFSGGLLSTRPVNLRAEAEAEASRGAGTTELGAHRKRVAVAALVGEVAGLPRPACHW